jgi:hypothetical protein
VQVLALEGYLIDQEKQVMIVSLCDRKLEDNLMIPSHQSTESYEVHMAERVGVAPVAHEWPEC